MGKLSVEKMSIINAVAKSNVHLFIVNHIYILYLVLVNVYKQCCDWSIETLHI